MDRMLYIAMTGAKQSMLAQAVNTNNLANVSTTAFRADLAAMRSMPVFGPGHPSRVYAMAERPGIDFSFGTITPTGRDLDVAVNGEGWIAVQGQDGSEAYTRAGNLQIASGGILQTASGDAVLGNNGTIAIPPADKVEIAVDGTISIRPVGQGPSTLAVVDRIKLVNPPVNELVKGADGLFRLNTAAGVVAEADGSVRVAAGALESSNVNAVEAMINMISLSRQFEMQIRSMRAAEDNDAASAQIMRME